MPIGVIRDFWSRKNRDTLWLLERFVAINSQSHYRRGVNKLQHMFAKQLKSLGFHCLFYDNPSHHSGNLLCARRYCGVANAPLITLVCHSDTVNSSHKRKKIPSQVVGSRMIGPGVLDDKSGMVTILEFMRLFLAQHKAMCDFLVICSPNEEIGSPGFHQIFKNIGQKSLLVLGFEPAAHVGHIISKRNGNRWYKVSINGRGGHAGRFEPGKVNALHELSHKIAQMHQLNDYQNQISINMSRVENDSRSYNTISDQVTAYLDVRFANVADQQRLHEKIVSILQTPYIACPVSDNKTSTSFVLEDDCPPLEQSHYARPYLDMFIHQYQKLYKETLHDVAVEGASDLNYFVGPTTPVIDGLGGIGGRMHCEDEWLLLESIAKRARALADFTYELQQSQSRGENIHVA